MQETIPVINLLDGIGHDKYVLDMQAWTLRTKMSETPTLAQDLNGIAVLLEKYQHYGQMRTVEEILGALDTCNPDYRRLCGIEMWGGSGAVWEVNLGASQKSQEEKTDRAAFFRLFIRLAETLKQMGLGTDRSNFIAATFQTWLDKGL